MFREKSQKGKDMIVAVHSAPPSSNEELLRSVRRAASLGFKAVQIGPLRNFAPIEGERVRRVLDSLNMERNVHIGGVYDAKKLASTEQEYNKAQEQIRYGMELCTEISSTLVSIHPPLFSLDDTINGELLSRARTRFFRLLGEEADFASRNHVKIALESFCYYPFIFEGLQDFVQFISNLPSEKLGVLLDMGHVYQMRIDPHEAVHAFENRLLDIHVHDATLEQDYQKATHLPIGKGTINFSEFINLLSKNGYDGWLTLEIRGSEREVIESKEYLDNLIERKEAACAKNRGA
ncbi:MAG: sugar phosphate isomerase/epimerase family protein [Candidatus Bathyarchaeia archaeon]